MIGNGDVYSCTDAFEKQKEYGCDGVMIGRAALGNPWVFSSTGRPATQTAIAGTALDHLNLIQYHTDVGRAVGSIKNHIGRYFRDIHGSAQIRKNIYSCSTFEEIVLTVERLCHEK